ncbi:hypothetical protein [Streptomyces sp. NPDC018693]|uniref:hypothetical protein n=1 Tax=unclassified Streptomyces TaxID=2593676 RepID=UPI00379EA97F
MKYSKVTGNVRWSQGMTQLRAGMSADDHHPLVVERPDLFGDEPPTAELSAPAPQEPDEDDGQEQRDTGEDPAKTPAGPVIERATAEPGQKRTTPGRGPARKTGAKGGTGNE